MSNERVETEHQPHWYPLLIVILICIVLVVSSGCVSVTNAYIPSAVLTDGWYENTALRNTLTQFLGLEQVLSVTYEVQGSFPASLTVMTLKSLVLMDEAELQKKTRDTIFTTMKASIELNSTPRLTGERVLLNGHRTMYMVFSGIDTANESAGKVNVIGEVWNCATSGTSIICIGIAYTTHTMNQSTTTNTTNWKKIVIDKDTSIDYFKGENGLIPHVICH